ncbi:MAG: hypothetical protein HXS52_11820 [Theionarchaea archaeon]|nr:hypothetical protein [Theionarchaea archaeon]
MSWDLKEETIEWYKVRTWLLNRKVYLTHEGVYIPRWLLSDIFIPYAAICKCNYFRNPEDSRVGKRDTCIIEYSDEKENHNTLKLHSCFDDVLGALKLYYSILIISQHQGHIIEQQLDKSLTKFVELLRNLGLYVGFTKPTQVDLEISLPGPRRIAYWRRELGILKLKNSYIHSIKVTESGYATIECV